VSDEWDDVGDERRRGEDDRGKGTHASSMARARSTAARDLAGNTVVVSSRLLVEASACNGGIHVDVVSMVLSIGTGRRQHLNSHCLRNWRQL